MHHLAYILNELVYNRFMNLERIAKEVFSYIKVIFFTWLAVFTFVNFLFRPVVVEGLSMYPTLHNEDVGISNIVGLKLSGVERFDIVVIERYSNADLIVKRVIGLPNEKIEYIDDKLYINGKYIEEKFLINEYVDEYKANGNNFTGDFEVQLGEDEYYCLGDNRPRSSDSRVIGPVNLSQIISKSVYILYPFSNFLNGN